uniref:DUF1018 domain-containing protein n=1 Tax=viral metagenome TaxID=1070528 RepID=A0A6M3JKT5_9ZZZZ
MRDPKRIKRICKILEKAWSLSPDQRLGQFLSNYVYGHRQDIFFLEDDEVEKLLNGLYKAIISTRSSKSTKKDTK